MQIKTMPTTLFKNKLSHFIQKISSPQKVECNKTNNNNNSNNNRKYSDSISIGTFDSEKFRQSLPSFFRRTSQPEEPAITAAANEIIYYKDLNHFQSLYLLTLDEINYAEDSQGSSYYSGDLMAAREALENCTNAFLQLLRHAIDPATREGLQQSISPKLLMLQKRIKALPVIYE